MKIQLTPEQLAQEQELLKNKLLRMKTPDQLLKDNLADEPSMKDTGEDKPPITVTAEGHFVAVPNFLADVNAFHEKFQINYQGPPRQLPLHLSTFRIARQQAELQEYADATHANQRDQQLDAIIDQLYVLLGTAHLHGFTVEIFHEAWRRVHAANMLKERVHPGNPGKFGSKDDIVKPIGWVAPVLLDLIQEKEGQV